MTGVQTCALPISASIRSTRHLNCTDVMLFAVRSDPTSTPPDRDDIDEIEALKMISSESLRHPLEGHAANHFTVHRQLTSRDLNAVCRVTCSDMVAMFYVSQERCKQRLQLSTASVESLWSITTNPLPVVISAPFTWFMDNNIAEVLSLNIMINDGGDSHLSFPRSASVSQLTLSMYMLLKSRIRMVESSTVSSILNDMRRVKTLNERSDLTNYDHFLLIFIYRKAIVCLRCFREKYAANKAIANS